MGSSVGLLQPGLRLRVFRSGRSGFHQELQREGRPEGPSQLFLFQRIEQPTAHRFRQQGFPEAPEGVLGRQSGNNAAGHHRGDRRGRAALSLQESESEEDAELRLRAEGPVFDIAVSDADARTRGACRVQGVAHEPDGLQG